ncbi:phosphate transporter [Pichia kluyveri]|uniref:Phosphate transporter n=1 Tax=Pichia kluyveri TaxID=36015 RepID=A0AAV5R926_PICKL|nr:phosphate transporter [Pichia kluyveri]
MAKKTAGGNAAFHNFMNDFADVEDPLERKRLALEAIDNASFGWYHVRTIMIGGVGFLTDAYDIFSVNLGVSYLAYVFWAGNIPSSTETLIKVSTSVGTVIGQLGFGYLADAMGRKAIYGIELMIMIGATILQCTAAESPAISFPAILTVYRILMGIGIGADYPLSSIITSEFAITKWRGAIMGAVFANQGWGQFLAGVVAMVCVSAYKGPLNVASSEGCHGECIKACDQIWRIIIGFGAVPGMVALYFRLTIPESPRYSLTEDAELNADNEKNSDAIMNDSNINIDYKNQDAVEREREISQDASSQQVEDLTPPKASFKDFCHHFGQWKYGKILLGTAGSWFMLDVAYYGLGLNTASILESIGFAKNDNIYESLYHQAAGNLILVCAGTIPGYWFTVATVDTIGRKPIQIMGFIILTALFCAIGFGYDKIGSGGRLGLYIVAQFFQNFGPNTTTFIVPGECYPTRYRSTAHGMSAASGKVGAILAQSCIGTLKDHGCEAKGLPKGCWLNHVMEIFALFMMLGIFTSLCIPETKRKTLEQLAEELHGEVDVTKQNYERKYKEESDINGSSLIEERASNMV